MYIIYPAQEVIQYTLPSSSTHNLTSYYAGRYGGYTRTMESLKGMAHPAVWSNVKNHITTSLAVVKNLSDFAQELSQMYEHHAEELQLLVGNYRKKNAELRKDGSRGSNSMIQLWEGLLQEVEADSQAHGEIASVLGHQVSRHTLERTFYRKVQARKILAHRESLDSVIAKSEETLSKCRQEYKAAYLSHIQAPMSNTSLSEYLDAHNTYVTQLHATNAMVDTYCRETLPELLTELEEVYNDLCTTLSEAIAQGAEIISNRAGAQSRRYCTIWGDSKAVDPTSDTAALVRNSAVPSQPHPTHRLRLFTPPHSEDQEGAVAQLKNTLVVDRPASIQVQSTFESLNSEADGLQAQIQHLQDSLSTMLRIQQRSIESSLFNKANEIQEDISMKRYELKTAQINLAGVKAKKELFALKMEGDGGGGSDRKMSTASTASMKSKWLKAFKSLKTPPLSNGKEAEKEKKHQMYHAVSTIIAMRRNGKDVQLAGGENAHQFQEYTYKKITPCDVCSQVLRGHTKQGLKCRLCKMNVHLDCQERVGKCQTKSRLLRRQKSSSDIETRATPPDEEAPHSPRRQKLNLRMKSLSLDSPESTEHNQRRRPGTNCSAQTSAHGSSHSSSSRLQSPSSPVHSRRLLSARNMRMSSVELPDDNEKSISSASTSPCPSPKPYRLLPNNLYVVLYNFKSRHSDELDLKAGYKLTVIDTSDPDWWRGKCLGRVGYFPSKYVAKVQPGERALQVTHNLQVADSTLLRDQIVIQIGEEVDGMVMIRSGDNRQGICPIKYLTEV
ncbi:uncharacterized protein LOC106670821 isoform X7 [Cimex lectularius]|uniref:SH3 and cysteine-rich domain-containing protein 3 n=1 Tax=Cimex lectularius TaxID=79782 RepID=A0A8I6SBT3_CIMLE|nr:uncharacterized protein LOC106670821 isoform X7 [Cimex lectularius]